MRLVLLVVPWWAALLMALPPAAAQPVGFEASEEGYEVHTPVADVVVRKEGYLLILDWDSGGTPAPGDDTVWAEETLESMDVSASSSVAPPVGGAPSGPLLELNLRDARLDHGAFRLLAGLDEERVEPLGAPVGLFIAEDGFFLEWELPEPVGSWHQDDGYLSYPTPALWYGVPLSGDDQSLAVEPTYVDSTDGLAARADGFAEMACAGLLVSRYHDTGLDPAVCPEAPASSAAQPLLPNLVLHSELQRMSVQVEGGPSQGRVAASSPPPAGLPEASASAGVEGHEGADEPSAARDEALPLDAAGLAAPVAAEGGGLRSASAGSGSQQGGAALLGAFAAVAGLALLAVGVPLYRRIVRSRLLSNDQRQRILELVRQTPGLHENAVARALGISHTLAQYHVRMLEEFGFLEVKRFGGRKCLFAAGQMGRAEKTMVVAERGRGAVLVGLVAAQPGIAQRALARALGVRESTIKWHLDRLEQSGVVMVERGPEGKRVRLSPEAERARLAGAARDAPAAPVGPAPPASLAGPPPEPLAAGLATAHA